MTVSLSQHTTDTSINPISISDFPVKAKKLHQPTIVRTHDGGRVTPHRHDIHQSPGMILV